MSNRVLLRSTSSAAKTHWLRRILLLSLVLFSVFVLISGRLLVSDQPLAHHNWALVLDGQSPQFYRSDAALQLMNEGWIDTIALSGTPVFRDHYTSQFAREDLLRQEGESSRIMELRHVATSTWDEARAVIPFFRERGVDTVLLVTSAFHTARSMRVFNALSEGNPYFTTIDIHDPVFRPWGWWGDREAAAVWFIEWSKTLVTFAELLFQDRTLDESDLRLLSSTPSAEQSAVEEMVDPVAEKEKALRLIEEQQKELFSIEEEQRKLDAEQQKSEGDNSSAPLSLTPVEE